MNGFHGGGAPVANRAGAALWLVVLLAEGGSVLGQGPDGIEARPKPAEIRRTQVKILLGNRQFQATVIAKRGDALTILTAAHCVSDEDEGTRLWIDQGGRGLGGVLESAERNPAYHPIAGRGPEGPIVRGVLCVDNAIATIRATPREAAEEALLDAIRAAELTPSPLPAGTGQVVSVRIIDQYGVEHVARAGNHLNPRCLAWGQGSYQPVHGDSGAGVFLTVRTSQGGELPLLIGNVAISDDRGGIAPLISRQGLWTEDLGPPRAPADRP